MVDLIKIRSVSLDSGILHLNSSLKFKASVNALGLGLCVSQCLSILSNIGYCVDYAGQGGGGGGISSSVLSVFFTDKFAQPIRCKDFSSL